VRNLGPSVAKGTEDFFDNNGNKIFDDGDGFPLEFDLGEPYSDNNDNEIYDVGEHFVDSNGNGMRDLGDGLWNGLNCNHSTLCLDIPDADSHSLAYPITVTP
jgi:hypothetical protein